MTKIALGTLGRFHTFDLARQLEARGILSEVFTGYPWFKLKDDQIPREKVHCYPAYQTMVMLYGRSPVQSASLFHALEWKAIESVDRQIAGHLRPCDIYIALASVGLRSGRRAKELGARYVCDRPCTHIVTQNELLHAAFEAAGVHFGGIDRRVIEKELAEYEQADLVLVPSRFSKQSFLARGMPEEKLVLAPYGVDFGKFYPTGSPDPERFDVLFVGAASMRKGTPTLLEAFKRIRHPRKRLVLIGAVLDEVRKFVREAESCGEVEVAGIQPKGFLRDRMSRSHVLVLPSVEDGFGMVMSEAMACGCPVIASDHTGANDLFEDGKQGFIVPSSNAEALAEAIQKLADDPDLRHTMGEAAIALVRAVGGWSQYADRVLSGLSVDQEAAPKAPTLVTPAATELGSLRVLFIGNASGTALHKAKAIQRLGHHVRSIDPEPFVPGGRFWRKFHWETGGLLASRHVERYVLGALGDERFDVVWVDNGRYIGPGLITELRKRSRAVVNYNHDDPFGKRDRYSWATYLRAVPYYDVLVVVRELNVQEAKARGAKEVVRVFMSSDEVAHRPRQLSFEDKAKYTSDVVFVGTALENRSALVADLLDRGVPLSIFGDRWERTPEWPKIKKAWRGPGTKTDDEYAAAILGSKIALGFLSKGNRDLHTTRSMEIPSMGGLFCAERTQEHLDLYKEGEEAVFWSDAAECAQRCHELLANETLRKRIACAGHRRALQNRHTNEQVICRVLDVALKNSHGS